MTNARETDASGMPMHRATELLRDMIAAHDDFLSHMGRELAVNTTDLTAMTHLISSGPLGPTELAKRLGMSTAAVTTVVDRLEAVGHASRFQHPTDRRAVIIVPSAASVSHAMRLVMPMITDINSVLDEFTVEQRDVITSYLERVVSTYQAQVPSPTPLKE